MSSTYLLHIRQAGSGSSNFLDETLNVMVASKILELSY